MAVADGRVKGIAFDDVIGTASSTEGVDGGKLRECEHRRGDRTIVRKVTRLVKICSVHCV